MAEIETFISLDGTQYIWYRGQEKMIELTDKEIAFIKLKVKLMRDADILNRESGNGTPMGIPIVLT